jgi:DNA-binding FadR family transcriptional regulator
MGGFRYRVSYPGQKEIRPMLDRTIRRKLYEHIEEAVGLKIIQGEYSPGDTLPNEDALCEEYGVSRGVIREAIKVLQKKGMVRPIPKIGTRIRPKAKWNLYDTDVLIWKLKATQQLPFLKNVTEVRLIIESEAARLSAERASPEESAHIERLCAQLDAVLADEAGFDYEEYLRIDMAFHTAILEASHNELLAQIGRNMRHAVQTARLADRRDVKTLLASQPHHIEVMAAIKRKDPDEARSASRRLFRHVWENIPDGSESAGG